MLYASAKARSAAVFPDISYSFYPVWCWLFEHRYETVPVCDDFTIDPSAYPATTGDYYPQSQRTDRVLHDLDRSVPAASASDSVVVIDEAYIDFGGESAAG